MVETQSPGKECAVLPLWVLTVTSCPLPSAIREQLRVHHSLRCHRDNHYELLHSFYWLSCYSRGSTLSGNGLGPLCVTENPELLAGPWAIPEETTDPAENQEEDFLRDPNLHLNIEESDKEFMAVREELYDSLMNRHWHYLDTVLSNVPDELPQCEVFTMPSNCPINWILLWFWRRKFQECIRF